MSGYAKGVRRLHRQLFPSRNATIRVVRAKQFIDSHYADSIDLDDICARAHFSRFHFIRLFKRHYGRTPHQYLTEVRVARAKELIRAGMTVRGACFAVGYDSMTSFSSLFRKMTGAPPSTHRKFGNSR